MNSAVGRSPDELDLDERFALAGKWVALERYTPPVVAEREGKPQVAVRLRKIEAIGDTVEECLHSLRSAGADPANYEFTRLKPPFGGLA